MDLKEQALGIIETYKYAGIYVLFVIDTLGVFMPSKTILTITGILTQAGQLRFGPLFLAAFAGSLTGFSISYTIGIKIGKPFLARYGKYLHITADKTASAEKWFIRYGPAFIVIAYFTPGLRHITPYLAGISGMSRVKAFFFAATGAALWITAFVSLGRFFGKNMDQLEPLLEKYPFYAAVVAVLAIALLLFFKLTGRKKGPASANPRK